MHRVRSSGVFDPVKNFRIKLGGDAEKVSFTVEQAFLGFINEHGARYYPFHGIGQ
jgi:hypothetical protein